MPDSRNYGPITEIQAQGFLAQAKSAGLAVKELSDVNGQISGYGAVVGYLYDLALDQIILTLLEHPPFLANVVWKQIEDRLPTGVTRKD